MAHHPNELLLVNFVLNEVSQNLMETGVKRRSPHRVGSWRGHSPLQAGKLLFQKHMVRCACFLTFKPLQVPRNPRGLPFTRKAAEDIRPKEVPELLLGALKAHARQPLPSLLMAMLPIGQLPQLLAGFGTGDNP
jgi:hypothetical protein